MASEDYMCGELNYSVIRNREKQINAERNKTKAVKSLDKYLIKYIINQHNITFSINNIKYTYWSKKNRVYDGKDTTNLTLSKFIKANSIFFVKRIIPKDEKICFGKYKYKYTYKELLTIDRQYLEYIHEKTNDDKQREFLNKLLN